MIIRPETDKARILAVLTHPAIWPRIAEEGVKVEGYQLPDGPFYLMDESGGRLLIAHWKNDITLEVHVNVIPENRERALVFGLKAINWLFQNTKATKLVAEIPEIYPDVLKFAQKAGFEIEGVNKSSYRRGGIVYDQAYVGLIKGE